MGYAELHIGVCQNLFKLKVNGVNTTINPSYFDVNKRATFGFDPVRHIIWGIFDMCRHVVVQ